MASATDVPDKLSTLFDKQPCWMIAPLAEQLDYSVSSVRRFLARIGYYSSLPTTGDGTHWLRYPALVVRDYGFTMTSVFHAQAV